MIQKIIIIYLIASLLWLFVGYRYGISKGYTNGMKDELECCPYCKGTVIRYEHEMNCPSYSTFCNTCNKELFWDTSKGTIVLNIEGTVLDGQSMFCGGFISR